MTETVSGEVAEGAVAAAAAAAAVAFAATATEAVAAAAAAETEKLEGMPKAGRTLDWLEKMAVEVDCWVLVVMTANLRMWVFACSESVTGLEIEPGN